MASTSDRPSPSDRRSLRDRLDVLLRPSPLAVEVTLALLPYFAAAAFAVVLRPMLLDPTRTDGAAGPALVAGLLAVAATLCLALFVLAHGAVEAVRLARDWPPEWSPTPRRIGRAVVRVAETVGAAAFLAIGYVSVVALSGDVPSPAGVGVMLLVAGAYLAFSGVVIAHGIGRVLLNAVSGG